MATKRTQPYRARSGRHKGPVLQAMRRGRSALRTHPMDSRRRLAKKRPRKRLSQIIKARY